MVITQACGRIGLSQNDTPMKIQRHGEYQKRQSDLINRSVARAQYYPPNSWREPNLIIHGHVRCVGHPQPVLYLSQTFCLVTFRYCIFPHRAICLSVQVITLYLGSSASKHICQNLFFLHADSYPGYINVQQESNIGVSKQIF